MGVIVRAVLPALAIAAATPMAAAETRTAQYGAVFCETLPSFRSLIAAMLARDEAAAAHLDDCTFFKPGVRAEVLKDLADLGHGSRIVQVRFYGNGASIDGYTLSNDLEQATLPEH